MTVLKRAAIAVVFAGTALSGIAFAPMLEAQVARSTAAPRATATDTLAQSYVAQNRAPGIVLAVGTRGQPAHFAHAGRIDDAANGESADADSLWRVYSMTKPITGMAAMMLVEDGKLRLDQPIHELIPAFKDMKVLTDPENSLASRPAARPITVRHLLTHTAGLGYSIVTTGPLKAEYERLGILPGAVEPKSEAQAATVRPKSLEEFANRLATLPLIADPGTEWSYSIGLDLLPRVIEVASGMSFEQFLETRMFGPLGMSSTYWAVPASEAGRLGPNYFWAGDNRIPLDPAGSASVYAKAPSFPYGGAGLVMSARDYDRFLAMLLNGGELGGKRVMQADTVRMAMSNLLPSGVTFGGIPGTGAQNAAGGYGAGGFVTLADVPGGPGAGTYGWGGAAGTIAWVDPKNGLRASAYVNYFPAEKWPLRTDLMKAVYSR